MKFEDGIFINAPCEKVYNFFEDMQLNYVNWHPDHHLFRWTKGKGLQVGNEFYFEETIAGEYQKKQVRFSKIIPNQYIEFVPTNWFFRLFLYKLNFAMEEKDGGCQFSAQIFLRTGPIGAYLHRKEFAAVRQHMREEGENLKRMLEMKG